MGEVGRALEEILKLQYEVYTKDVEESTEDIPKGIEIMHVCLPYFTMGHESFIRVLNGYVEQYRPIYIDVCSTVRPGTTSLYGPGAVHSTTRGLHPNLASGLRSIPKHIGGPAADVVAGYFKRAGVRCITHKKAITTEVAHILNNSAYGVSLMFADEMSRLCREYGVDYYEAVMRYTATHNTGFRALDHERLVRPILTPPNGKIGGHCVTQGASLIPEDKRGRLMDMLAHYNDELPDKPQEGKEAVGSDLQGVREVRDDNGLHPARDGHAAGDSGRDSEARL